MAEDNTKGELTPEKHLPEALEKNKWKKGQSGNPDGRPVGSVSIVEGIKRKLLEIEPANKKTYLELFLSKLFLKAIHDGNEQLMKDMINRVDGMPKQSIEGKFDGVGIDVASLVKTVKEIMDDTSANNSEGGL